MADDAADNVSETPELHPFTAELADQGFAIVEGFPVNLRLRGEALVAAGLTTDPGKRVDDDFIAETKARVDAEAKDAADQAAATAAAKPSMSWTRDALVEHATGLGLTVETDANKAAILDAINAAPAAGNEG